MSSQVQNRQSFVQDGVTYEQVTTLDKMEIRGSDKSYAQTDMAHWRTVQAARRQQGLQIAPQSVPHELVGKTLRDRISGEHFEVESVTVNWCYGNTLLARLRQGSYRASTHIANLSSRYPGMDTEVSMFPRKFEIIA